MRYRTVHLTAWLVPALIAFAALALPSGAAAAVPGTIGGTVTSAGAPVAGIEVCAFGVPGTATAGDGECAESASPNGEYEITGLAPGNYFVEFWPQGENYVRQFWEDTTEFASASQVPVVEGFPKMGIDAELEEGATISGTVTAAATGAPVAKVEVCAFKPGYGACAVTGLSGQYTIVGLPAGSWEVYFYTDETGQDLVSQPYPTAVTTVAHGAVPGINAALQKGGAIAGTVKLAATGAPLAGVRVCLVDATEVYTFGCLKSPASGRYRFYGLPAISYKIVFSPETSELVGPETEPEEAAEYAEAPDAYPTQWWNGKPSFGLADPIAITPPGEVTNVDGSLGPPPVVAAPAPVVTPAPVVVKPKSTKPLICHKGFAKRKVKGKLRCLKVHKKHHHRRHHKKHPRHRAA